MMKGMAGVSGAGRIPMSRAVHGVRSPIIIPPASPTQIVARASKKFTEGPVKNGGKRNPCSARVRARKSAVRVRKVIFTGTMKPLSSRNNRKKDG
jgi:hypothetical protein